jgi:mannan endo-1,4-beta-mannosidase
MGISFSTSFPYLCKTPHNLTVMRYRNLFLISIACVLCACQEQGPRPVNPKASKEACELLEFLYSISGKFTMAGEHNFSSDLDRYDAEVLAITGKLPVVWGSDFSFNDIGDGFERY